MEAVGKKNVWPVLSYVARQEARHGVIAAADRKNEIRAVNGLTLAPESSKI
ncbi:MAG: hypothetical protein GTN49_10330 [candidate division Zixibacteria bacterium]|nr:hypothetical protein [candidate division Zixibacteria bacterium]